jgi:hypothetical protein
MRELIRKILRETTLNNNTDLIQEHVDTSKGSKFTYLSLVPYSNFQTKRYYFNKVFRLPDSNVDSDTVILSGDFGDFEFNKDLLHYKDPQTIYIDKSVFDEKYSKLSKKETQSKKIGINSSSIKEALKLAFPNNWHEQDKIFTAGLRGVFPIGEKLGDLLETWSIMNWFDTKDEIHQLLYLKYREDETNDNVIDWMVDLFKNNKDFTQLLVNRQWKSIKSGLELERNTVKNFLEVINPTTVKYYPHGSIMDRYEGVDVTIDGFNYQIKPLTSFNINDKMEYVIKTYGMRDYQNKKLVDYIAYANNNETLIFENSNYIVDSKFQVTHKNSPKLEGNKHENY